MSDDRLMLFDSHGAIRVYDPDKFDEMVKTLETQKSFLTNMDEFKSTVASTMTIVQQLGKAIEKEKMRAVGARNVVETEADNRKRSLREAQLRLYEKQAELDRYIAEYNALQKVDQEQRHTIQRLSGVMQE